MLLLPRNIDFEANIVPPLHFLLEMQSQETPVAVANAALTLALRKVLFV